MKTLEQFLHQINACDESKRWVSGHLARGLSIEEMLQELERPDWLMFLLGRLRHFPKAIMFKAAQVFINKRVEMCLETSLLPQDIADHILRRTKELIDAAMAGESTDRFYRSEIDDLREERKLSVEALTLIEDVGSVFGQSSYSFWVASKIDGGGEPAEVDFRLWEATLPQFKQVITAYDLTEALKKEGIEV